MDPINASSFPINQALRAYSQTNRVNKPGGSPYASNISRVQRVAPAQQTQQIQSTQPARNTETVGKIRPDRSTQRAATINQLVSAKVEPINLTSDVAQVRGPKPITTSAGTYAIHASASERNQAATGVALGRSLDLRG